MIAIYQRTAMDHAALSKLERNSRAAEIPRRNRSGIFQGKLARMDRCTLSWGELYHVDLERLCLLVHAVLITMTRQVKV